MKKKINLLLNWLLLIAFIVTSAIMCVSCMDHTPRKKVDKPLTPYQYEMEKDRKYRKYQRSIN